MKILVISDIEAPALWDYFHPSRLDGIDLILSCGDLDPRYLSFLATFPMGRCFTSTEIMTKYTRPYLRRAVSA